jgi:uncharacterized protein (TIGR03067 family)
MNERIDDPAVQPKPPGPAAPVVRRLRPATRRWIGAAAALLGAAAAIGYGFLRSGEPTEDLARFQGEWQLAIPASDHGPPAAARLKPVIVRIHGDRWIYVANGNEQRRYAITLRPDTDPKEIDLIQLTDNDQPLLQQWPPPPQPVTIRGIYAFEQNRAKVATSIGHEPRPTSFEATDGVTVWLLERIR